MMKKVKVSLILSGLIIAGAVIISSCKKSNTTTTPTPDTSTTSASDNNLAQKNAHDITNFGSEGIDNQGLTSYKLGSNNAGTSPIFLGTSGSVTLTPNGQTLRVTFYSFVGNDGHTRNGTILYDWHTSTAGATWFRDSGLVLNITTPYNDYTVDNYTVQVNSKTITNNGRNSSGNLNWTDNSNLTITKPASAGGGTIQWQANWTMALLNTSGCTYNGVSYPSVFHGYGGTASNAINWTNAILSISSTGFSGTASDGETYTGNVSNPLVLNLNCTPPGTKYLYVAGTLNFTPTNKTTRTIDYGSGACDLTCTVSIGSYSVTITF